MHFSPSQECTNSKHDALEEPQVKIKSYLYSYYENRSYFSQMQVQHNQHQCV